MWNWERFANLINPIQAAGQNALDSVIGNLVSIILTVSAILAFIYLVYSGIQYITSGGDPSKTTTARNGIIYAIIGIIIVIISFSLINFISRAITHGIRGTGVNSQGQSSPNQRPDGTPTRLPNPLETPLMPNSPNDNPARILDPNLMIETPPPSPRSGPF